MITESEARSEQAREWVAQGDGGILTGPDRVRFENWITADRRNLGAYVQARCLYESLGYVAPADERGPRERPQKIASERRRFLSGCAAALVAGLIGSTTAQKLDTTLVRLDHEAPKNMVVHGADITLDAQSAAWVPRASDGAVIRAISGRVGVRAALTPVHIEIAGVSLTGASSDFDINVKRTLLSVVNYSGFVKIRNAGTELRVGPKTAIDLARADNGTFRVASSKQLSSLDLAVQKAWRTGQIIMNNMTLVDAIAQLNRYSKTQCVIADKTLESRQLNGSFSLVEPLEFARAVSRLLRCKYATHGERVTFYS